MPCEFCRTRKISKACLKVPGPKKAALAPSRQIPTAIDAVIESQHIPLLQWLYSNSSLLALSLVAKSIASQVGPSLPSPALRHAILAYSAFQLNHSDISHSHLCESRRFLIRKVRNLSTIDDTDFFAALFLTFVAFNSSSTSETLIHAAGCRSIFQRLHSSRKPLSRFFEVFGNYAVRMAAQYSNGALLWSDSELPSHFLLPTWKHGERWTREMTRAIVPNETGFKMDLFAAGSIMSTILPCLTRYVGLAALQELGTKKGKEAERVGRYLREVLEDPDFQNILPSILGNSAEIGTWEKATADTCACLLRCIRLCHAVVGAPSVLGFLLSTEANSRAFEILESVRPFFRVNWSQYSVILITIGLALTNGQARACMPTSINSSSTDIPVGQWIVNELCNFGCPHQAYWLQQWWRDRTLSSIVTMLLPLSTQ